MLCKAQLGRGEYFPFLPPLLVRLHPYTVDLVEILEDFDHVGS